MIENTIQNFRRMRQEKSKAGQTSRLKTKQRLGLAQRQVAETDAKVDTALRRAKTEQQPAYDPAEKIEGWYAEIEDMRAERANREQSTTGALSQEGRPEARYEQAYRGGEVPVPEDIKADTEFTTAVSGLAEKYGITESEIYSVIQGESAFNPMAQNPSGATGLFQFMPAVAEELGTSTKAIRGMSPAQQVELYDKYLERWDYSGDNRLGIMQAAPAFASRGPEEVIYDVNSAAWKQNPGWRELNDGPITVRSINNYYVKRET